MIIDGKRASGEILEKLTKQIKNIKEQTNKVPGLGVIMVGEDAASKVYVRSKIKNCAKVGILSKEVILPNDTTEEELLLEIDKLNKDKEIHGVLVQLPLPRHISEKKVCEAIDINKDVDGFKAENIGKVLLGEEDGMVSCTPQGIMYLIDELNIDLYGKNAVVLGRSNIVGKPISALLINRGATTTVCNSRTKNLKEILSLADIVIVAIGQPKFLKRDMVKEGGCESVVTLSHRTYPCTFSFIIPLLNSNSGEGLCGSRSKPTTKL